MILVVEESSGTVFVPGVLKFAAAVADLGQGVIQVGTCSPPPGGSGQPGQASTESEP